MDERPTLPTPPEAPRRPHTWPRPTGPVEDPYAWLANREDPETISYLEAENAYAAAWFAPHQELIDTVYGEIKSRTQETDESVPVRDGDWWYVTRTIEGQAYAIHCRGRSLDTATDAVMLDGNVEAAGREYFDIHTVDASPDQRLLAWSSDVDGSERYTLRVRDLSTGEDLDELVNTSSWGGVAWSAGSDWLFYAKPDEQMRPFEIWRHRLGSDPSEDTLVVREDDDRFSLDVSLTRSRAWIVITAASKTSTEVRVVPATDPTAEPRLVRARAADVEYGLDDWGDRFVVLTNLDAPDFRVMTAGHHDPAEWTEFLPHQAGRRIVDIDPFAGHLAVHEWSAAQPRVRVVDRAGRDDVLDFGEEPHDIGLGANATWDTTELRVHHQSLTSPPAVWDVDLASGERALRKQVPTPGVDLGAYTSERLWATAPDGTKVPVDVVRHVDTPADGRAPCVVYAYGSYEYSLPPYFSVARLSLLDRGVLWALVHPRGGGELGRQWYLDGKLLAKRNTFTDTIAAADHLVEADWVDGARVGLRGGSAGGLLVGACLNLRPDRWRTVVAEVPFVDVVTTMSDASLPLTAGEWEEWGDPREEPWASYMLSYSPYDNVVAADYPAIFVTAGLNDPRVSYHEPAKWTAKLRSVGAGTDPRCPLVLRTEMGAGHGGPSGRYEAWRDEARTLTFLLTTLSPPEGSTPGEG